VPVTGTGKHASGAAIAGVYISLQVDSRLVGELTDNTVRVCCNIEHRPLNFQLVGSQNRYMLITLFICDELCAAQSSSVLFRTSLNWSSHVLQFIMNLLKH